MSRKSKTSSGSAAVVKTLLREDSSSSSSDSESSSYGDLSDDGGFVVGESYENDYSTGKAQPKKKKISDAESKESIEHFLGKSKKSSTKKAKPAGDESKADDLLDSFINQSIPTKNSKKKAEKKSKSDVSDFAAQLALKSKKNKKTDTQPEHEVAHVTIDAAFKSQPAEKVEKAKPIAPKPISEQIAKRLAIEAPVEVPEVEIDSTQVIEYEKGKGFDGKYPALNRGSLVMFLYHAYEDTNGYLYLFGKTTNSQTVCVRVMQTYRVVYFLPRNQNNLEICKEAINKKISGAVLEEQNGFYAFGTDIPYLAKWIKAFIPGKRDINALLKSFPDSTDEYTRVFHLTSDLIESFMLNNKIYGPCWVEIENLTKSSANLCSSCALFDIDFSKPTTGNEMTPVKQLKVLSKDRVSKLRIIRNVFDNNQKKVDTPYFNISAVSFRMKYDKQKNESQICMITVTHFKQVEINSFETPLKKSSVTFVNTKENVKLNGLIKVQNVGSEAELINSFISELKDNDVDMVLGYDLNTFASQILYERIKKLKIRCSDLGRINKLINPKDPMNFFCGRLPVDLRVTADEFLRVKSNDFTSVILDELGETRVDIDAKSMESILMDSKKIINVAKANYNDSLFIQRLAVSSQVIPLTLQIAQLSGAQWARVLIGKASPRSEALLSHNFTDRRYIIPNKSTVQGSAKRGEAQFKGGHVLDPMVGFHEHCILLLDYNSLYPSIIRQYDICFATILTKEKHESVLPKIMQFLLEERKKVKVEIKNIESKKSAIETEQHKPEVTEEKAKSLSEEMDKLNHEARVFDIKQKAIKILANAMYGYLGYKGSRFPAQSIAELITKRGREALDKVINIVNTYQYTYKDENGNEQTLDGFKIVYGDTDSVMVDSNTTDVKLALNIAAAISGEVNKKFKEEAHGQQLMELGIDGIFLKMLLVSKKKYAALLYRGEGLEPKLELKGLDMVRRDWCDLMKYTSYYTICQFMNSDNDIDTAVDKVLKELKRISEMLNDNGAHVDSTETGVEYSDDIKEIMKARGKLILDHITPKMLSITKVLKQDLSTYSQSDSMPHVKAAKIMAEQHKSVEKGASISYIIVDTNKLSASESEDENIQTPAVKSEKHADVLPAAEVKEVREADIKYYLESQLYNTTKRLCTPFGGCIDPSMIANALGVTYVSPSVSNEQDQEQAASFVPHTKEIVFNCPYCDNEITVTKNPLFYTQCSKCNEEINTFAMHNMILYQIRKYLRENNGSHLESRGIFQKEIETCQLPLSTLNVAISTTPLSLKTSPTDIFNNLRYFAYLFEPLSDKMRDEIVKAKPDFNFIKYESFSEEMLVQARRFLDMHAFSHINFFKLLSKARGTVAKETETAEDVKEEENNGSSSEQEDSVVESEDEEI